MTTDQTPREAAYDAAEDALATDCTASELTHARDGRAIHCECPDARRVHLIVDAALDAVAGSIAARALREASRFTTSPDFEFRDLADVRDWLSARADRIENGSDR
jgi:hypothetical protein